MDQDLLDAFLTEARDLVVRAAGDLDVLAARPGDAEALEGLFRSLHTLKGSTALFDLPVLTALLHAAETRLEDARRAGALPPAGGGQIVRALDQTEGWLDALAAGTGASDIQLAEARDLTAALEGDQAPAAARREPAGEEKTAPDWARALGRGSPGEVAVRYRPGADAYFRGEDPLAVVQGLPGLAVLRTSLHPAASEGPYDPFQCRLAFEALCLAPEAEVRAALRLVGGDAEVHALPQVRATPSAQARTVRVPALGLDRVAALVDDLVIAKNGLSHAIDRLGGLAGDRALLGELQDRRADLERRIGELHGAVTDLRLVALRGLFARLPRLVRETAARLDKRIELAISGEDVALDKAVVETLFEPLLHLLRNSIGHGVEPPETRRRLGKPEPARLAVAASTRGDFVCIEVADDGAGIDPQAIRRLAVGRGVIDAEAAAGLDDAAAAELVFARGFSTAGQVSDVAGRGVGMDAVRETLAGLGGRVELDNRPGAGLTVRLLLPARTVLTRVLVVEAGGARFAAPLQAIGETRRVRAEEVTVLRASRTFVRRDTVVPIQRLRDLLDLPPADDPPVFPVLVLAGGEAPVAVQVDALGEQLQAPLRPLGGMLAGYPGLLGSILQGDGRVLLVLDLAELSA